MQSAPQSRPAGVLVTVPEPEPFLPIESVTVVLLVPDPLTPRDIVSPPAVKVTLPAKVPPVVGRNRTVTTWLAPAASEKDAPDTTL